MSVCEKFLCFIVVELPFDYVIVALVVVVVPLTWLPGTGQRSRRHFAESHFGRRATSLFSPRRGRRLILIRVWLFANNRLSQKS